MCDLTYEKNQITQRKQIMTEVKPEQYKILGH